MNLVDQDYIVMEIALILNKYIINQILRKL